MRARSFLSRLLLLVALTIGLSGASMTLGAAPANAAGPVGPGPAAGACGRTAPVSSELLPVVRWGNATNQFHSRLSTDAWGDVLEKLNRNSMSSYAMVVGNAEFGTASQLTEMSGRFCPIDAVGGTVDRAAASIGKAVINNNYLIVIAVIVALVTVVWRAARSGLSRRGWGDLFKKAITIAVIGVMVAGATASTGGGIAGSPGPYKPGRFSPGYFITGIDKTVSLMANGVITSLSATIDDAKVEENSVMGCDRYVGAMKSKYRDLNGLGTGGSTAIGSNSSTVGVPVMISGLWEQSGLVSWRDSQFGPQNVFGKFSYCRLLDRRAGSPIRAGHELVPEQEWDGLHMVTTWREGPVEANDGSIESIMHSINKDIPVSKDAPALGPISDNNAEDKTIIAATACRPSSAAEGNPSLLKDKEGWVITNTSKEVMQKDKAKPEAPSQKCADWWNKGRASLEEWNVDAGREKLAEVGKGDLPGGEAFFTGVGREYVTYLHGYGAAGAVQPLIFAFTGAIILVVFGLVAGGVLVAKTAALVLMLTMMLFLALGLFSNDGNKRVVGLFKQYVGISLFSFAAQFMLAMIAFLTKILVDVVNAAGMPGGPGGILSILWVGLSPLLALMVIGQVFKMAKLPSPFSLKGGLAWGEAMRRGGVGAIAGGAGGAAGALGGASGRAGLLGGSRGGSGGLGSSLLSALGAKEATDIVKGVGHSALGNRLGSWVQGRKDARDSGLSPTARGATGALPGDTAGRAARHGAGTGVAGSSAVADGVSGSTVRGAAGGAAGAGAAGKAAAVVVGGGGSKMSRAERLAEKRNALLVNKRARDILRDEKRQARGLPTTTEAKRKRDLDRAEAALRLQHPEGFARGDFDHLTDEQKLALGDKAMAGNRSLRAAAGREAAQVSRDDAVARRRAAVGTAVERVKRGAVMGSQSLSDGTAVAAARGKAASATRSAASAALTHAQSFASTRSESLRNAATAFRHKPFSTTASGARSLGESVSNGARAALSVSKKVAPVAGMAAVAVAAPAAAPVALAAGAALAGRQLLQQGKATPGSTRLQEKQVRLEAARERARAEIMPPSPEPTPAEQAEVAETTEMAQDSLSRVELSSAIVVEDPAGTTSTNASGDVPDEASAPPDDAGLYQDTLPEMEAHGAVESSQQALPGPKTTQGSLLDHSTGNGENRFIDENERRGDLR